MTNRIDEFKGRVKEAIGDLTADRDLKADGRIDQLTATVKDTVDQLADRVRELAGFDDDDDVTPPTQSSKDR